jgi:hypothetical protein
MVLDTAQKMYRYFLSEIRKERTIVITPAEWTAFINPIFVDWVKTKLPEQDFNQKRIDDLESIKVVTDGLQTGYLYAVDFDLGNVFKIPYNEKFYPRYMQGVSAEFGYSDVNHQGETGGGGGGASPIAGAAVTHEDNPEPRKKAFKFDNSTGGKIFRSDKRVMYKDNPYRQESNNFIHFEQRGNYIYCKSATQKFNLLKLEYYRYPTEIVYDGSTDNAGSFKPVQNKEVLDMAVTRYLERVSDQRIQTQPSVSAQVPK